MKTVIMAGGMGTRISSLFPDIPKPLIPISDGNETKPVLEWEINSLVKQGFNEVMITVSYMADKIIDYFGDGSRLGANINYYVEERPLGNAGALFKIRDWICNDDFVLINADSIFDIDFNRMVDFHKTMGGLVTLFTHPNDHPYDSGLIIVRDDRSVENWLTKEDFRPQWYKNRVNAGLHIISPQALEIAVSSNGINVEKIGQLENDNEIVKVDLDRQVLKPLCGTGKMYAYDSPEYVKDMGTPERFIQVCQDFRDGIIRSKNLNNAQKAIFLDRDGTLNREIGFLSNIDDLELLDGVTDAIKRINKSGYLAIVVTNQPVIARGEVTISELEEIHNKLETLLGMEGAYLDDIYYCPHHPDKGFPGELSELKITCECRKPKPGMLLSASYDYNINLSESWMIGDSEKDIIAGKSARCKTALIGEDKYGQDITANNLLEAIDKIFL